MQENSEIKEIEHLLDNVERLIKRMDELEITDASAFQIAKQMLIMHENELMSRLHAAKSEEIAGVN
jgi:hypothetical protein